MSTRICLSGLLILACLGLLGIMAQHQQLDGLKDQKGQILAQLSGPPAGVTRAGILSGDVAMRQTWAAALGLDVAR